MKSMFHTLAAADVVSAGAAPASAQGYGGYGGAP